MQMLKSDFRELIDIENIVEMCLNEHCSVNLMSADHRELVNSSEKVKCGLAGMRTEILKSFVNFREREGSDPT